MWRSPRCTSYGSGGLVPLHAYALGFAVVVGARACCDHERDVPSLRGNDFNSFGRSSWSAGTGVKHLFFPFGLMTSKYLSLPIREMIAMRKGRLYLNPKTLLAPATVVSP